MHMHDIDACTKGMWDCDTNFDFCLHKFEKNRWPHRAPTLKKMDPNCKIQFHAIKARSWHVTQHTHGGSCRCNLSPRPMAWPWMGSDRMTATRKPLMPVAPKAEVVQTAPAPWQRCCNMNTSGCHPYSYPCLGSNSRGLSNMPLSCEALVSYASTFICQGGSGQSIKRPACEEPGLLLFPECVAKGSRL